MRRFCGVVDCTFSSPRQPPWGVSRRLWGSTPQLGLSGPKKRTSWHCPVNMVVLLFELVFLESLQFLDLHEDFQAFGSFSPLLLSFMYMGFSAWKDPEMMVSTVFKNHTQEVIHPMVFHFQCHKPYPIWTKISSRNQSLRFIIELISFTPQKKGGTATPQHSEILQVSPFQTLGFDCFNGLNKPWGPWPKK